MKPERLREIIKQLDALTYEEFQVFKRILLIRGMRLECGQKRPRKWDGHWILKDCNPTPES